MRTVGIYLRMPPEGGGAFQYCDAMLDALIALSPDRFRLVVATVSPVWQESLRGRGAQVSHLQLGHGFLDRAWEQLLRRGLLPLRLWTLLAPRWHRNTRRMLESASDLWIFPAQDHLGATFPGPSLSVIHDLMHRYERRFPEVSAGGEFARRERHYRRQCERATGILVDSELGKRQAIESYSVSPAKVHVLPYVAAPSIVEPPPAGFDERYRLPAKYFFYPAQFWQHKNHVALLRALKQVREQVPDLHLVLSGAPKNNHAAVLAAIGELGLREHVHLLGYVPQADLGELYRRSLGLVMPTFFGPTNIPPLEAMQLGVPVAVSDIYGMREQCGEAAEYFDPLSETQIADAMRRLATDPQRRQDLSRKGLERARAWDLTAFRARLGEILDKVLP
jgi:glycosyltransferase involved in cell wall biosynthesis